MHRPAVHHAHVGHRTARPPLPSPVISNSVSPTKRASKTLSRGSIHGSPAGDDEDELASGNETDPANRRKLEQKREKNRIKQRNLRLRRQNHINELEAANSALQNEIIVLRNTIASLQQRENNLNARVRDLESALFAHGHSTDVNHLRTVWSAHTDPLSPLANAAAVTTFGGASTFALPSRRSSAASVAHGGIEGITYPTSALPWDQQMPPALGVVDDWKRKRDSLQYVPSLPAPEPPHAHRYDTRPPIHSNAPTAHRPALPPFPQHPAGPAERPNSAPHMPSAAFTASTFGNSTLTRSVLAALEPPPSRRDSEQAHAVSPHPLRIADLLSPARDDPIWTEPRSSIDSLAELDSESGHRWSTEEVSIKLSPKLPALRPVLTSASPRLQRLTPSTYIPPSPSPSPKAFITPSPRSPIDTKPSTRAGALPLRSRSTGTSHAYTSIPPSSPAARSCFL